MYKRNTTPADLLENNIKMIYSSLACNVSYVSCLDLKMHGH